MRAAKLITKAGTILAATALLTAAGAATASAAPSGTMHPMSGCSIPPCGAITNETSTWIDIKWTDNDGATWSYASVGPGETRGGYFNDGTDVDFWELKNNCTAYTSIHATVSDPGWYKIKSSQTEHIYEYSCY